MAFKKLSTDGSAANGALVLGFLGRGTGVNDTTSGICKTLQPIAASKLYDIYLLTCDESEDTRLSTDFNKHINKGGKSGIVRVILIGHSWGAATAISRAQWFSTKLSNMTPPPQCEIHLITIDAITYNGYSAYKHPTPGPLSILNVLAAAGKQLTGSSISTLRFTSFVNLFQTQGKQSGNTMHRVWGGPIAGATNREITITAAMPKGEIPHTWIDDILSSPLCRYVSVLAQGGSAQASSFAGAVYRPSSQ